MSREQRIESIIQKRKPQADKVRRAKKNLSNLQSILDEVESCREKTLQRAEDPAIRGKLSNLRFSAERDKIRQCLDILSRLESRFSRDTLTIAFVGRAGQGKSRLIQSITGLTKSEVPDGTGGNCTGVKCTVCNEITDEPYGEVYFYSKQSFLQEVIYPYYDFLHLGEKPTSLSSFTTNPLPKIIEGAGAEALSYYAFLVKCHDNYSSFESLLEENSPKRISRGEIREYVAQTREDNQSKYFNYLAVREVKIFCHFPNEDIGEIALIDLPGLGDTVLGDKDKVRSSLGHDVDFAIFVARPHTRTFQEEDYRLYDIANDALTELPIAKWSAVTLNQDTVNSDLCNLQKQLIETEGRIRVTKCLIADCTNDTAAAQVLESVLDELDTNLVNLDNEYSQVGNAAIKNLQADLKLFFDQAKHAFAIAPTEKDDIRKFRELFGKLRKQITKNLFTLLKDLRPTDLDASANTKDTEFFKVTIESIIQKCYEDNEIPTSDEILAIYNSGGGGGFPAIFAQELDHLRINIRKNFTSADNGLKEYVDTVKVRVAECFTETPLGNLTHWRGSEFLKFMAEEISSSEKLLKEAFHTLYSFEMTYKRNFQYRILKALEDLDSNRSSRLLNPDNKPDEAVSKSIQAILETLHRAAICACQEALEGFEGEPSLAVYAEVDDFTDQIVRSNPAIACWEDFTRERSSQIWLEEFGQKVKEEKKEWVQLIDKAITANKFDLI